MGPCCSRPQAVDVDLHKPEHFVTAPVQEQQMLHELQYGEPLLGEERIGDVTQVYHIGKILGRGHFGATRVCIHKETGEQYAIKSILKSRLHNKRSVDVRKEMQIMLHLAGSPNIVQLYEAYEDQDYVHLVMELCTGGELMQRLLARGRFTERDAAAAMRSILRACAYCHELGVIHRDLKPENLLLADSADDAQLKVADYGLSTFYRTGQHFSEFLGTPFYVCPELLRGSHDAKCDIWSCGVILYLLLIGQPPFGGTKKEEILHRVLTAEPDFWSPAWMPLSHAAKDCCMRMLTRDPAQRPSAREMLQHEWIRADGVAGDVQVEAEVVHRLRKFAATNQLKKEALMVIAANMPVDEVAGLQLMFADMDADGSGTITLDELREGLRRKGTYLSDADLEALLLNTDVDGDGAVDYQEFVAATMHACKLSKEDTLLNAFKQFDIDESGHISRDELWRALSAHRRSESLQGDIADIMAKVDTDADGKISYPEFRQMMREQADSPTAAPGLRQLGAELSRSPFAGPQVGLQHGQTGLRQGQTGVVTGDAASGSAPSRRDPGAKYRV